MRTRSKVTASILSLLAGIFLPVSICSAREPLEISLTLPGSASLGTHSGKARIMLGQVSDEGFAENTSYLGMGPQSIYTIQLTDSREETVKKAILHLLKETGLLAASPQEATATLDVRIVRNHFTTHQTAARFRLRSEVFLDFSFKRGNAAAERVLACGNAETHAQIATKEKIKAVYQAGINDALFKLVNSKTFARLVGEGWKPGSRSDESSKYEITRIDKASFYGPTDSIQEEVKKASTALESKRARHVILQDFVLKDTDYSEKEDADPKFASRLIPELVRENLNAFYPGAFETIDRGSQGGIAESVEVSGDLLKFKVGSFYKRALIGFGAGKDKLEITVVFNESGTTKELYTLHILSSGWGAAWQMKRGQVRDMADQAGRDIAYFLVTTLVPGYSPPTDLEVCFD